MKTKIGTEVAHVTRDSDTAFEVKKSKGQRSTCRGGAVAYCGGLPHSLIVEVAYWQSDAILCSPDVIDNDIRRRDKSDAVLHRVSKNTDPDTFWHNFTTTALCQ